MRYSGDPQFDIQYGSAVLHHRPVARRHAVGGHVAGSLGDGSRRMARPSLVRRFVDIRYNGQLPGPGSRISLGTWYGEDGRTLDVFGHFVDGGRGLHCNCRRPTIRALPPHPGPVPGGRPMLVEQHPVRRRHVASHGDGGRQRLRPVRDRRHLGHGPRRMAWAAEDPCQPVLRPGGRSASPGTHGSIRAPSATSSTPTSTSAVRTETNTSSSSPTHERMGCSAASWRGRARPGPSRLEWPRTSTPSLAPATCTGTGTRDGLAAPVNGRDRRR